jgi:hypothetical protein
MMCWAVFTQEQADAGMSADRHEPQDESVSPPDEAPRVDPLDDTEPAIETGVDERPPVEDPAPERASATTLDAVV